MVSLRKDAYDLTVYSSTKPILKLRVLVLSHLLKLPVKHKAPCYRLRLQVFNRSNAPRDLVLHHETNYTCIGCCQ